MKLVCDFKIYTEYNLILWQFDLKNSYIDSGTRNWF